MRRLLVASLVMLLASVNLTAAQDRATLVADSVTVQSGTTLAATGHVEVFFKGQRLTAAAITYDQTTNRLVIAGPIRIDDGKGNLFLADQAEMSADLTEGLLTSARLVLNQHLQLAAAQIERSDGGNLTAMRSVVASSCTICAGNPTPLWEIRAREVVHDNAAQQLYFSDAVLRFYGVPVLYVPILRVPDPSLSRATGFLLPKLTLSSTLGNGLKIPYFITMGTSRDLTLTPFLTDRNNQTLGVRYREAFATGMLDIEGAVSNDTLGRPLPRGYLTASGNFDLGKDYKLDFDGTIVSDRSYLVDYGISNNDRLESQADLTRVRRDLDFSAQIVGLESVREGESNSTLPTTASDLTYEKRFNLPGIGGSAGFDFSTHTEYRSSTDPLDSNGDGTADGRDLNRISMGADWNRNWTAPNGMVLQAMGIAAFDTYAISQDATFGGRPQRLSGAAGVALRWPWAKQDADGGSQILEPVVQLVTARQSVAAVPNSDSTQVEFDEANLYALDRFPGADAVEVGTWVNLGLSWLRDDPQGWSMGATAGRVVRLVDEGQFSAASGLDGQLSDWLLVWSMEDAEGLALTTRVILDDGLSLTKGELRFDYTRPSLTLAGGYVYLLADASEARTETASEIRLQANADLSGNWSANLAGRYDIRAARLAESGLELAYRNECIDVTLSLSRTYTSSTSVTPSTEAGLSVELLGFGGGPVAGPSHSCRR